ncbi:MAG TPA: cupredoxin domain-containing protein [Symbiobacteriaceae bacterium]|jgi:heme/copper-type cytochrome/quinol oxidase subunit 2
MRTPRQEWLAGLCLAAVLVGTPAVVLAYQMNRVSADVIVQVDQEHGFAPNAIYVHPGEPVRLQIHAKDVVHGFQSPKLGVRVDEIYPGKPALVEFTAPRTPGEYVFACARMCGTHHGEMLGKIVVLP